MKHYYRIGDAIAQVMLLLNLIYAVVSRNEKLWTTITVSGCWYIISVGIHVAIGSLNYKKFYKEYAYVTTAIIALLVVGYFYPVLLLIEMYYLAFAVPALAIFFTYNCFAEITHLRKRPISYIK